jgi:DNA gyrase/topoisomerase IV subunit A
MEPTPTLTELDRWLSALNEEKVEIELRQLEDEATALQESLKEGATRLGLIQAQMSRARQALELKREAARPKTMQALGLAVGLGVTTYAAATQGEKLRGREAIRRVVRENTGVVTWTIPAMVAALTAAPWAEDGETHAVGVAMQRMEKAGEFTRPQKGVYQVTRSGEEALSILDLGAGDVR